MRSHLTTSIAESKNQYNKFFDLFRIYRLYKQQIVYQRSNPKNLLFIQNIDLILLQLKQEHRKIFVDYFLEQKSKDQIGYSHSYFYRKLNHACNEFNKYEQSLNN
jgi:hypothetical protein